MIAVRPLLVSFWDTLGGAARAAYRLHKEMQRQGIESSIFAGLKSSDDPSVRQAWLYQSARRRNTLVKLDRFPRRFFHLKAPLTPWSTNLLPTLGAGVFNRDEYSLINLHWIGNGFVPIRVIGQIRKPIVWTLHDMWPFTGGCHHSAECPKYMTGCGACPQLASSRQNDLSRLIWRAKHHYWQSHKFAVVSPSRWLANRARQSALFHAQRVEIIPNGVNTQVYRPIPKQQARAQLGLAQETKLILFAAMNSTHDRAKGYNLLHPALHHLAQDYQLANLQLMVVGGDASRDEAMPPIPIHHTGYVFDEDRLATIYAAADLFVLPSLVENLPNTVMEALACGTPSVAFDIGGIPDMIEHQRNGYLAKPFEVDDLAHGMAWVLQDDARRSQLADRARQKVEQEFTQELQAERYVALFREILTTQPQPQ